MTLPAPPKQTGATGRGAWTRSGGLTPYYELTTPAVGSTPTADMAHWLAAAGVAAIQTRINTLGYGPALDVDGWFGSGTDAGVRWVQQRLALTVDGQVGSRTTRGLFVPVAVAAERTSGIPGHLLCGLIEQESTWDPAAQGYDTPADLGLVQINGPSHPTISAAQACDPNYAVPFAARSMKGSYAALYTQAKASGADPWQVAVAHHNSPLWAQEWAAAGRPPNQPIADYVAAVQRKAAAYS